VNLKIIIVELLGFGGETFIDDFSIIDMSIISYFGGKSSNAFIEFINSKIPKTGVNTYLEPFSGSFATYLDDDSLMFNNVYYNDKNTHQVNLMYCCSKPKEFLPYLNNLKQTLIYTTETDPLKKWDFYKSVYKEYIKNDFLDDMNFEIGDFEKAAIYAFLITSSHNSVYPRGGGYNGYKKDKDRLKLDVLIAKLEKNTYTKKLQSITEFSNIDFEELIRKYDSEETYLYLDPPYARFNEEKDTDDALRLFWYGSDKDGVFGPASHRRLLELIKTTKCRWSLSYYYFPLLEELLPKDEYVWTEKVVFRSSAQGGNNCDIKGVQSKGVELLIMNYDPTTGKKL
jgi:site-specific DNA-adenine methylase